MSDDGGLVSLVDLSDSEYMEAIEIAAKITTRYQSKTADRKNLMALVQEIEERYRDEMGLEVTVNPGRRLWREVFGVEMEGGPLQPENMSISIEARYEKEFDLDKAVAEAQAGIADPFFDQVKAREAARAPARKAEIAKGSEEVRKREGHPRHHH